MELAITKALPLLPNQGLAEATKTFIEAQNQQGIETNASH